MVRGTLSVESIHGCLVHCSCSSAMLLSFASIDVVVMIGASLVDGSGDGYSRSKGGSGSAAFSFNNRLLISQN